MRINCIFEENRKIVAAVLFAFFLVLLNYPINIFAQNEFSNDKTANDKSPNILTLQECINIALKNNYKIKASGEDINIADARKKQAESGYWPQVSASALYSLTNKDPQFILPNLKMSLPPVSFFGYTFNLDDIEVPQTSIKLMDKQNIHAAVELTYPLYTGGKVQALNREAAGGIEIAKQEYRKSSMEVEYDVKKFYYAVLLTKKIYSIGTDALAKLEVTLELTESMYKNGSGKTTKLDYLKNKVIVDQVRTIVNDFKKNIVTAKEALVFTMGTKDAFTISDEPIPYDSTEWNESNVLTLAYKNNPDLEKLNSAVSVYKAKIDEAFSNYLPNVALVGSFNQNFNSYKYGVSNLTNATLWMVGLGVQVPVFNGFRTKNEVEEAEAQLKKIGEQKNLLHDAITFQIKEAINKINSSTENVKNTFEAKQSATESRSLNERAFKQDMAEAKDLIEAQIMESLMEIQYEKALYDHIEAENNLELLLGTKLNHNQ